jgi:hypothetical protein
MIQRQDVAAHNLLLRTLPVPARTRYRELNAGTYPHSGSAIAQSVLPPEYQSGGYHWSHRELMDDFTGNLVTTNPLSFYRDCLFLGTFNGSNGFWTCSDWKHDFDPGFPGVSGLSTWSDDVIGTMALAQTNPNSPVLDVWNFLFELKDIPRMVKDVFKYMRKYGPNPKKNWPRSGNGAREISKDIGSAYLNWTFGWDLLFRDIAGLLDFVGAVEKRQRELEDLSSGVLKKTATIGTFTGTNHQDFYWGPLYSAASQLRVVWEAEQKIWARVRYVPSAETFKYRNSMTDYQRAKQLVFGHTPSMDTLWNALPWSWLLDWFTTAGDYFAANRNQLGVTVDDVAIMRHVTVKIKSADFISNPHNASFELNKNFAWSHRHRVRWTGLPVVTAFMPNLSIKQLSILAAIGTKFL